MQLILHASKFLVACYSSEGVGRWNYFNFPPGNLLFSEPQAESCPLNPTKSVEQELPWLTLLGSFRHHFEVNRGMIKSCH